jgi:DNA modification methylase
VPVAAKKAKDGDQGMSTALETTHRVYYADARHMAAIGDDSVNLVVTSPPYPMIKMWDALFSRQDPEIAQALERGRPREMFARMHALLDPVWDEVFRVLRPGGFACINIGDAVRSFEGEFGLYANHVRILDHLQTIGFTCLPDILWRKPTNAPTKFMGSGMLPAGAYVTLEHEYILIVRKSGRRRFTPEEQQRRRSSAIFWEERNRFFSDIWTDLRGTVQALNQDGARARSAAFPFELAYRLILMYAIKGDTVLDPFWGTGTTTLAAATAGRRSIGYEIETSLVRPATRLDRAAQTAMQDVLRARLEQHVQFARDWEARQGPLKYRNSHYGFGVMTRQEQALFLDRPCRFEPRAPEEIVVGYDDGSLAWVAETDALGGVSRAPDADPPPHAAPAAARQRKLF